MTIFVRMLPLRSIIVLDTKPLDTIEIVKSKIKDKNGIPIDTQRLVFGIEELEDRRTDYHEVHHLTICSCTIYVCEAMLNITDSYAPV